VNSILLEANSYCWNKLYSATLLEILSTPEIMQDNLKALYGIGACGFCYPSDLHHRLISCVTLLFISMKINAQIFVETLPTGF